MIKIKIELLKSWISLTLHGTTEITPNDKDDPVNVITEDKDDKPKEVEV